MSLNFQQPVLIEGSKCDCFWGFFFKLMLPAVRLDDIQQFLLQYCPAKISRFMIFPSLGGVRNFLQFIIIVFHFTLSVFSGCFSSLFAATHATPRLKVDPLGGRIRQLFHSEKYQLMAGKYHNVTIYKQRLTGVDGKVFKCQHLEIQCTSLHPETSQLPSFGTELEPTKTRDYSQSHLTEE